MPIIFRKSLEVLVSKTVVIYSYVLDEILSEGFPKNALISVTIDKDKDFDEVYLKLQGLDPIFE
jgi:hypothetical protein